MRCRSLTTTTALLALFLFNTSHTLSQQRELSVEQLAQKSELIAVGKVSSLQSEWNAQRTKIYTRVQIAVSEQLKGSSQQSSLTIVTLGGEVEGIGESYSHTAKFVRDEQVVVFASRDAIGQYRITGGEQGKFTVKDDDGVKMVAETLSLDKLK